MPVKNENPGKLSADAARDVKDVKAVAAQVSSAPQAGATSTTFIAAKLTHAPVAAAASPASAAASAAPSSSKKDSNQKNSKEEKIKSRMTCVELLRFEKIHEIDVYPLYDSPCSSPDAWFLLRQQRAHEILVSIAEWKDIEAMDIDFKQVCEVSKTELRKAQVIFVIYRKLLSKHYNFAESTPPYLNTVKAEDELRQKIIKKMQDFWGTTSFKDLDAVAAPEFIGWVVDHIQAKTMRFGIEKRLNEITPDWMAKFGDYEFAKMQKEMEKTAASPEDVRHQPKQTTQPEKTANKQRFSLWQQLLRIEEGTKLEGVDLPAPGLSTTGNATSASSSDSSAGSSSSAANCLRVT